MQLKIVLINKVNNNCINILLIVYYIDYLVYVTINNRRGVSC